MKCLRCQRDNATAQKYCGECGTPLTGASQAAPHADPKDDNERLRHLLAEAREQQAATSEILQVISSSPTDARPVFETIVASAGRLCGAESAVVYRLEGGAAYFAAHDTSRSRNRRGVRAGGSRDHCTRRITCGVSPMAPCSTARISSRILACRPRFAPTTVPAAPAALLWVPMVREGQALGAISVTHRDIGAFSPTSASELLKTFADQAVIAIENVRLFKELEARNRGSHRVSRSADGHRGRSANHCPVAEPVAARAGCHRCECRPLCSERVRVRCPASLAIRSNWPRTRARTTQVTLRPGLPFRNPSVPEGCMLRPFATVRRSISRMLLPIPGCRKRRTPTLTFVAFVARPPCPCSGMTRLVGAIAVARRRPGDSLTTRSPCSRPSPTKRSSRSRTSGCSPSCRRSTAIFTRRWITRRQQATSCGSSALARPMCSPCSRRIIGERSPAVQRRLWHRLRLRRHSGKTGRGLQRKR